MSWNTGQMEHRKTYGDVGLPVSCYRIQPPYENFWQLECHWHDEMELFKVERGTVQIQCGNDYFEAREGDLVFSTAESFTPPGPLTGRRWTIQPLCSALRCFAGMKTISPGSAMWLRWWTEALQVRRVASSSSLLQMFDQAVELLQNREVPL